MNLYLVTLSYYLNARQETFEVYAVAPDMLLAGDTALKTIRNLEYKYDKVKKVELIASVNSYSAEYMLAIYYPPIY